MIRFLNLAKPTLMLLSILGGWWLIPMAVKSFLRVSFFEFQAPFWTAASFLDGMQEFWSTRNHSKLELFEAGQDLARLNAAYELRVQENETLRAEVYRLEKLLNLPSHPEFRYEISQVVRRDLSNWWHQFIIRKGRNYGILEGNAVVYSGGVVGRIKEVHLYTSVVELVSSRSFRVAAQFEDDDRPVTFQGGVNLPFQAPMGEVVNVQPDIIISTGAPRRLVSSRLGGVFPDGLMIGWADRLTPNPDGLLKRGMVILDKRLLGLKEVAVLLPIEIEGAEQ